MTIPHQANLEGEGWVSQAETPANSLLPDGGGVPSTDGKTHEKFLY